MTLPDLRPVQLTDLMARVADCLLEGSGEGPARLYIFHVIACYAARMRADPCLNADRRCVA